MAGAIQTLCLGRADGQDYIASAEQRISLAGTFVFSRGKLPYASRVER
jgi:hypothetical protein